VVGYKDPSAHADGMPKAINVLTFVAAARPYEGTQFGAGRLLPPASEGTSRVFPGTA